MSKHLLVLSAQRRRIMPERLVYANDDCILCKPWILAKPRIGGNHQSDAIQPHRITMLLTVGLRKHALVQTCLKELPVRQNHFLTAFIENYALVNLSLKALQIRLSNALT